MKTYKFRAIKKFKDVNANVIREVGEYFNIQDEERVNQLLNKEEKDKVVELYEIRHS